MLVWIGVRGARGAPLTELSEVELLRGRGLAGDVASQREGGKRQVSLLQAEHLEVMARLLGCERVTPGALRRNLVVAGINLLALRATTFRIGGAVLRGSGTCEPCSKMERALGVGGYNAVRGHGGILAQVVEGALVRVGDEVDFHEEA